MKKLIIFIALPLVLLIGAGLGALFFGLVPGFGPQSQEMAAGEPVTPTEDLPPPPFAPSEGPKVFYTPEEFVVNLRSERRLPVFLLLSLTIEISDEALLPQLTAAEPRVRDVVNLYLSSLTPEQLAGYDGIQMVRTELWKRLRAKIDPEKTIFRNIQIMKMTVK